MALLPKQSAKFISSLAKYVKISEDSVRKTAEMVIDVYNMGVWYFVFYLPKYKLMHSLEHIFKKCVRNKSLKLTLMSTIGRVCQLREVQLQNSAL